MRTRNEISLSREELFALPEYSCSEPTGVFVGKRWRCDVNSYPELRRKKRIPDEQHEWLIGEYLEHPTDETKVLIRYSWALDENHEPHRGTEL